MYSKPLRASVAAKRITLSQQVISLQKFSVWPFQKRFPVFCELRRDATAPSSIYREGGSIICSPKCFAFSLPALWRWPRNVVQQEVGLPLGGDGSVVCSI